MDNKFYVSPEAAMLLKEKGYDRECISYYHDNCREVNYSFCGERNSTWEERCVSASTKSEAIDWLESKGIVVEVVFDCNIQKWYFSIYKEDKKPWIKNLSNDTFPTRLEAEEAAIIKALELL